LISGLFFALICFISGQVRHRFPHVVAAFRGTAKNMVFAIRTIFQTPGKMTAGEKQGDTAPLRKRRPLANLTE